MGLQIATRPVIWLEGQDDQAVSASLLRFEFRLSPNGTGSGTLEFNNWGMKDGVLGYLYFNDARFARGKSLQVKLGLQALPVGRISEVSARYPGSTPPTIELSVTLSWTTGIASRVQLSYGNDLLDFDVTETWQAGRIAELSRDVRVLNGKGSATFMWQLLPGMKIDLQGIGARYAGEYTISEVLHNYDQAAGLKTQFTTERVG